MKKLVFLGFFLSAAMGIYAEDVLSVTPVNIPVDFDPDDVYLEMNIKNDDLPVAAVCGDIYLPDGVTVDGEDGVPYILTDDYQELGGRLKYKSGKSTKNVFPTLSHSYKTDSNGYKFAFFQLVGTDNMLVGEGPVAKIYLKIDKSKLVEGKTYPVYIKNVYMQDGTQTIKRIDYPCVTSFFTYGEKKDGVSSVLDVEGYLPTFVNKALNDGEAYSTSLNMSKLTNEIIIDEVPEYNSEASIELSDEVGISNVPDPSIVFGSVSYTRSTLAAKYGTICVPFDLASDANVQYYTISEAAAGQITISKVASVPAGTPAIYENLGASNISYSGNNVTLAAAGVDGAGAELVGTYAKTKVTDANTYYLKDGKFNRINGSFNSGAFKAYAKSGSALAKALEIFVDDADPTAINGASTSASIEGIYNAAGAQNKKLEKGVNILKMSDGSVKKVLVK
ncbi:MAG: hypothetical protein MJZ41_00650 [Bacteroidaceae bacterium]|nr:hypothetical protein [Bacteroidaceae bacterium]